jgi:hypothetical protein
MINSELKIVGLVLPPSHPSPKGEGVKNSGSIDIISPMGEIRKGVNNTILNVNKIRN